MFDRLIAINERRIEILEGVARSLYREWFVRRTSPDLRQGESVLVRVGEVATAARESITPAKTPTAVFEHFSLPAFDAGQQPVHETGEAIRSAKLKMETECVLVAKLNPRIPRVWLAEPHTQRAVASTEFVVLVGRDVSNAWLWAAMSDDAFRRGLTGTAGGTSTSHQRVKPDDILSHEVWVTTAQMDMFDAIAVPALTQTNHLRRQNRHLISARDMLLPRLVTGQLAISDIDLGDLLDGAAA